MTIILAMLQRKGKFIEPQDVAAAVLTQGADETRREMIRLMAEDYNSTLHYVPAGVVGEWWQSLAWTLEETARGLP